MLVQIVLDEVIRGRIHIDTVSVLSEKRIVDTASVHAAAITDTVARVFHQAAYQYAPKSRLAEWQEWLAVQLMRLVSALAKNPLAGTIVRVGLYALLAVIVLRILYEIYVHYAAPYARRLRTDQTLLTRDMWAVAQELAERGAYTEAAHALYLALLQSAKERGYVTLHDSKTVGDYTRELRSSTKPDTVTRFREFSRSYETIVYSFRSCTADGYATLHAMASQLTSRW